ncbi:hypothetical protein [Roseivirga sp. E12]|uniref:hypothetical protein n=1 Tax=Roseivirga sp. E12 TaxID=2819237 RepID=UPI001ABCC950|nr:hypothetical protein [Roseivirga sp. E12]MBO3697336.1 hypothetical protein [Roseivirga sp. E12]
MSVKRIKRKIASGELELITSWKLDSEDIKSYLREQVKSDKKQAIQSALILPVLFFIILVVQTRGDDFASFKAFFDYFKLTFLFPAAWFPPFFIIASLVHKRKRVRLRKAAEAQFGNNWFLFGTLYLNWNRWHQLRAVQIDHDRKPKVIMFQLEVNQYSRSRGIRTYEIPIPKNSLDQAITLEKFHNQNLSK